MVALGMLTPKDVERVLARQRKTGLPFGECALRLRKVKPKQLEYALSVQFAYQYPVSGNFRITKDLAMAHEPFGEYGEALRSVSSRLLSQWWRPDRKTLAITSSEPREGRSHLAANLAVAFAQFGRSTLLIDADMRRPGQHRIFNVSLHPGLSRLLCGFVPESENVLRPIPFLKNLALITSGPCPPNAVELISHDKLGALLRQARDHFDVLIVDTPCSTRYIDAEIIAESAGSALVVACRNRTRLKSVHALKQRLAMRGVNFAGVVVNTI